MPNTTAFDFGDIVLVPFPFTDQTTTKQRPAVVVSSQDYQRERADIIVLAITSRQRRTEDSFDVPLQSWRHAGLIKPSLFKPLVTTIERRLVRKKLGEVEAGDRRQLSELLAKMFGA